MTIASAAQARAAITASWHPITISAAAIADDPVLANMQSWDLRVTTDGNWASAGLRLTLPAGNTFYKHAPRRQHEAEPGVLPDCAGAGVSRRTSPRRRTLRPVAPPAILGGFPEGSPQSLGNSSAALPGVFSTSWGDLVTDPPGNYRIVRVTFPQGVIPQTHELSNTSQVNPDSTTLLYIIPEPAAAPVGHGGWLAARVAPTDRAEEFTAEYALTDRARRRFNGPIRGRADPMGGHHVAAGFIVLISVLLFHRRRGARADRLLFPKRRLISNAAIAE